MAEKLSLWIIYLLSNQAAYDSFLDYMENAKNNVVNEMVKLSEKGLLAELQAASLELKTYNKIKQSIVAEYREKISQLNKEGKE